MDGHIERNHLVRRGNSNSVHSAGEELLTSTGEVVGRWKENLEDLLKPTVMSSDEGPEAGDSEVDSSITQAEVTEVVRKLLGVEVPEVEEISPEDL